MTLSTTALAVAAALAGCAVGPDFKSPAAPAIERVTARALPAATAATAVPGGDAQRFLADADVPAQWWTRFDNAELNRRVQLALANSPTVASAQAALRQGEENLNATRGGLLPSVDARAGITRQRTNTAAVGSTAPSGPAFTLYNTSVNVSWGMDLFGAARRTLEGQAAQVEAQRFQLEGTYLSLVSNVVTASVQEASLRAQIKASEQVVAALSQQIDLAKKQVGFGSRAEGDLLPLQSQLSVAQAQLPALRQSLARIDTQLAVYLGRAPSEGGTVALELDTLKLPTDIPVSLPSKLVQQRADVRAAESVLHAATAQIGVATANLLPQLTLSGSLASQSARAGNLFSASSGIWSLGIGALQPIFHGGSLQAQRRAADAGLDKAVADYQNVVLGAFKNVADALEALQFDADTLQAQADYYNTATRSYELVQTQYRLGAASYLQLLDAQRQFAQAQSGMIQARAARLADTAALFAALGGGWWNREQPVAEVRIGADGKARSN
jgi:NodT family efflux transporter outer membrane factor (OMF) lipoprotein